MSDLMGSVFNLVLRASAPLLIASAKGKPKKSAKPAKKITRAFTKPRRKPKAKPVKKPTRPAKPVAKPATKLVAKKGVPEKKVAPKPAVVVKPASAEPFVKPVPPSGRAILLSPDQDKFADSVHPKFRWLSVGGATRYEVMWGEKSDLSDAYSVASIATEATVPVERPLKIAAMYYWRVRGGNESGWGPWSNVGSFRVLEDSE